eukprot:CAMPEP_0113889080 /NCGR_PEP_ID=MMETSP0780_2-20120614/13270_1 /TAXON_ID=652834 /ORGANISM="Palpitomonas bilix" /LENGTH=428 /DNA_ID=CAMNT_0000878083 /DNA_START=472 /DNA_END=1758 /DNA_ORIENTATION=+ /assembly_acc=CAM_ASM_000599
MIVLSRIPVGIFKHAVASTQAAVSHYYHGTRGQLGALSRHNAFLAAGFIFGPTLGGTLSKFGNHVPAFISCSVFFINFLMVYFFLDLDVQVDDEEGKGKKQDVLSDTSSEESAANLKKNMAGLSPGSTDLKKRKMDEVHGAAARRHDSEDLEGGRKIAKKKRRSFFDLASSVIPVLAIIATSDDFANASLLFLSRFVYGFITSLFKSNFTSILKFVLDFSVPEAGFVMSYGGFLSFLVQMYGVKWFSHQVEKWGRLESYDDEECGEEERRRRRSRNESIIIRVAAVLQMLSFLMMAAIIHTGNVMKRTREEQNQTGVDSHEEGGIVSSHMLIVIAFATSLVPLYTATGTMKTHFVSAITNTFPDSKGEAVGSAGFLDSVCRVITPMIGGLIIKHLTHSLVFVTCSAFGAVLFALITVRESIKTHTKTQ